MLEIARVNELHIPSYNWWVHRFTNLWAYPGDSKNNRPFHGVQPMGTSKGEEVQPAIQYLGGSSHGS